MTAGNSETPSTAPVPGQVPFFLGRPELLFGVHDIELSDDEVSATVEAAPWLSRDGHGLAPGSLGVLFDDVLGYAILRCRPEGLWSVSTEITLDVLGPLPVDGQPLLASARVTRADERGGFARGEVRNAAGEIVAVGTQRGRFVAGSPEAVDDPAALAPVDRSGDLGRLLWGAVRPARAADGRTTMTVTDRFVNPMGNLHGGMSLCLAEWAAAVALEREGDALTTASIHVDYVRPVPGGTAYELESTVLHRGRTTGVVLVVGRTESGRPGTIATVTAH